MIAELISVGTELLMGQIVNTDAQFMSEHLAELGVNVFYQVTVGDNPERLEETVKRALDRSDVVILSGGLGPTGDDLTKETVARLFDLEMETDQASLERLKKIFERFHAPMTPNNLKQVDFPKGSIVIPNARGTAPGCIVEKDGKVAILLPGPPRELFPMFRETVMPYLEKKSGYHLLSHELRIFGKGESEVEYEIKDIIEKQTNPTIAPYAKLAEVTLRITARCKTNEEGEALIQPMIEEIKKRFGDVVYSTDGQTLEAVCGTLLRQQGKTVATAESCTGGMVASTLIGVPGSSAYMLEGMVTYSNAAKINRLGVKEETIAAHGAVSEECAREMAEGIRRTAGVDIGVATTGIAGPDGGTPEKPVGRVYIAVASEKGTTVRKHTISGERQRVREISTLYALDMIRRELI